MNTDLGELSAEEQELILRHREKLAQEQAIRTRRLNVLQLAAQFELWMQENPEHGNSYGTFVNSFGYQGSNGPTIHESVLKVIEAANIRQQA